MVVDLAILQPVVSFNVAGGDPSDGLWSMYLTEVEKQDKEITDRWKRDTDGILVFVSPGLILLVRHQ
jgi:hypothetical protein